MSYIIKGGAYTAYKFIDTYGNIHIIKKDTFDNDEVKQELAEEFEWELVDEVMMFTSDIFSTEPIATPMDRANYKEAKKQYYKIYEMGSTNS